MFGIDVQNIGMFLDDAVHDGLSKHGFVDFVVTVFPVADQIHDDVLVEGGTIVGGDAADVNDGFGVIGVDVEDGGVHDTADVGTVWG